MLRLMGEEHLLREEGDTCPITSMPVLEEGEDGTVTLHVEGTPVAQGQKPAILIIWCAAFYIFNIKTTNKNRNTNWLIRTKVLDLSEERKPDMAVQGQVKTWMKKE